MQDEKNGAPAPESQADSVSDSTAVSAESAEAPASTDVVPATESAVPASGNGAAPPPAPPPKEEEDEDPDERGMLRMSFLEHLEELRARLIRCVIGIGVAFLISLIFANQLWVVVSQPALKALKELGYQPQLAITRPMETFSVVWVKLPMLTAIFLASPWILYQVWAFIAPGLYKRERRWAAPFVICSAGLFISGGLFAYFVVFRFGLTFLLGIGRDINILPVVTITEYFELFINVTLGVGLTFELPVLIFFLTLLRIVSPAFLLRHSRYAILAIVAIAAVITPTPDVFNLMMFVVPMLVLYFLGVFASYLLVLHRENRKFPWKPTLWALAVLLAAAAGSLYLLTSKYGYHLVPNWPFLVK